MPELYIIAGCNGAGKTTAAYTLLPEVLDINEFVNADEIARGLSPFNPESVAFSAGRIMLERIKSLISSGKSFVIESTLSSKTYQHLFRDAQSHGYEIIIIYLWIRNVQIAIARVNQRVKEGGHHIPEEIIKRRYKRGRANFLKTYRPLANYWIVLDNTGIESLEIAKGTKEQIQTINDQDKWNNFLK